MKRVGVVDIGSNAIRMMIVEGDDYETAHVVAEERVSLRLGHDAFTLGTLSDQTRWQFYQAMLKIRLTSKEHGVQRLRAVATSALRNSKNSEIVISDVKRITGIHIELISGKREAEILKKATDQILPRLSKQALAMDVGGGSAEFSTSNFGVSLPLGTVRLLEAGSGRTYEDFALTIRPYLLRLKNEHCEGLRYPHMIATGGNIKSLARLCYRLHLSPSKYQFSALAAQKLTERLFEMSFSERKERLKLDADRADVILPASCLLLEACRIFQVREVHAPNVGLKNGVLLELLSK